MATDCLELDSSINNTLEVKSEIGKNTLISLESLITDLIEVVSVP